MDQEFALSRILFTPFAVHYQIWQIFFYRVRNSLKYCSVSVIWEIFLCLNYFLCQFSILFMEDGVLCHTGKKTQRNSIIIIVIATQQKLSIIIFISTILINILSFRLKPFSVQSRFFCQIIFSKNNACLREIIQSCFPLPVFILSRWCCFTFSILQVLKLFDN